MEQRGGGFPATRHSIIERLRTGGEAARTHAFGDVVEAYWKPVYTHLRLTWRLDPDDAQDATQGLFAEAFEKGWLERFDPAKARFRTFVRLCADRVVQHRRDAAAAAKRGGAVTVPLDFEGAERLALARLAAPATDPDAVFHEEFVRGLFERAVEAVRLELEASGKATTFAMFERHDLAPRDGDSYAAVARDLGVTVTQVTNGLALARRRFREQAIDALRRVSGSDDELRRDARELFGVEID